MALANEAGKTDIMERWATMWRKMVLGVGSFSGCNVTRSEDEWQKFSEVETKRNTKKNMKTLAKDIAGYIGSQATGMNGDPVLPGGVPPEILACWKKSKEDAEDAGKKGEGDKEVETDPTVIFETEVQKLKKEVLVSTFTIMQTEDAKTKEATKIENWAGQVQSIISLCAGGEDDGTLGGVLSGGDALSQGPEFLQRFPETKANKHWLAQQAAAVATQICQRIKWLHIENTCDMCFCVA